jgi:hypothetical protein
LASQIAPLIAQAQASIQPAAPAGQPVDPAPQQVVAPALAVGPAPQQVVAPALAVGPAPAPGVGPSVATNAFAPPGPPSPFRAIALGWNADGKWIVRTGLQLQDAGADAVQSCNSQYGGCALSDAAVAPTAFGCLVLAKAAENGSRLFAATGGTLDAARDAVVQQASTVGATGQIQYAGCNA